MGGEGASTLYLLGENDASLVGTFGARVLASDVEGIVDERGTSIVGAVVVDWAPDENSRALQNSACPAGVLKILGESAAWLEVLAGQCSK